MIRTYPRNKRGSRVYNHFFLAPSEFSVIFGQILIQPISAHKTLICEHTKNQG